MYNSYFWRALRVLLTHKICVSQLRNASTPVAQFFFSMEPLVMATTERRACVEDVWTETGAKRTGLPPSVGAVFSDSDSQAMKKLEGSRLVKATTELRACVDNVWTKTGAMRTGGRPSAGAVFSDSDNQAMKKLEGSLLRMKNGTFANVPLARGVRTAEGVVSLKVSSTGKESGTYWSAEDLLARVQSVWASMLSSESATGCAARAG